MIDVEAAREYELPQHQLGDESDTDDDEDEGVKDTQHTDQRVPVPIRDAGASLEVDEAPDSGRRLI